MQLSFSLAGENILQKRLSHPRAANGKLSATTLAHTLAARLCIGSQYKEFTETFKARAIARPPYYSVPDSLARAPYWFAPTTVWEIQGAELTVSPNYLAAFGLAVEERGLSLRFPRFLRVREDKEPEGCTSANQLAEMYRAQTRRGGN